MQEKDSFKVRYENRYVGGNGPDIGQSVNENIEIGNPSSDGFAAPSEYNDPASGILKKSTVSISALAKALQFVIALIGTSVVGLGILFSSVAASFQAKITVSSVYERFALIAITIPDTEDIIEGDFEVKCESKFTTSYSQSFIFSQIEPEFECEFFDLKEDTTYVVKFYKDGKLVAKKDFKTQEPEREQEII